MLKCNELMFGDWITEKHGYPMQVTTVGKDYLYADFEDNEGDVFEFDDEDSKPYPVTLTDDFFERNNFDKKVLHYSSEKHRRLRKFSNVLHFFPASSCHYFLGGTACHGHP